LFGTVVVEFGDRDEIARHTGCTVNKDDRDGIAIARVLAELCRSVMTRPLFLLAMIVATPKWRLKPFYSGGNGKIAGRLT
jgi:hypothetical protein